MSVGQQAFSHRHRQVRDARAFDERANVGVGLRIGGALAEDDQRTPGGPEQVERALDSVSGGNLPRCRVDDLDQ